MNHLDMARQIRAGVQKSPGVNGPWQWGTVQSIQWTSFTASVYLDNNSSGINPTITPSIPWLASYTPVVGDAVLIGRMQGAMRSQRVIMGNLSSLRWAVRARAYRSTALTIPNGNSTVSVATSSYDLSSLGLATSGHFVAPFTGFFAFAGAVSLGGAGAAGTLTATLTSDSGGATYLTRGSRVTVAATGGAAFPTSVVHDIQYLTSGSTVYLGCYQDTGAGQPCLTGTDATFLAVTAQGT